MMFHVGQMVVCVKTFDKTKETWRDALPVKGGVYVIRDVFNGSFNPDGLYLRFEEIVNPPRFEYGVEVGFNSSRFRPVKHTSIEQFTAILNQAPERVDA